MSNIVFRGILRKIVISGTIIASTIAFANNDDPFQIAKQSLQEDCEIIWLQEKENLTYGSQQYHKIEQGYEQCKSAQHKLKEARKSAEKVEFLDGQFYTLKPASWSILDDLNDEADLQMGNLSQEAYCIIISESKIDYESDFTLEEYSELASSFILEAIANPSLSEAENMILNGQSAIKYDLAGSIDGIRVRYWHVSIDTESHFHQVILWSLPSKFDRNKADYEAVLNSFNNRF